MKKKSLKFPKDMTTDELDEAIRSLIKEGELSSENAWEVREAAISMHKGESSKRRKASKERREFSRVKKVIGEEVAKNAIAKAFGMKNDKVKEHNEKDMLSDIEHMLNWLDSAAESLSNSAHFNAKFFVDEMRKKYGIKTETTVSVAFIFDPRGYMTVDEYKKVTNEKP